MRWLSVFLVALMAIVPTTSFWPGPAEAQGPPSAGSVTVPGVTGTDPATGNVFTGAFTITRFAVRTDPADGVRKLYALGTLVGTLVDPAGQVVRTIVTSIAMPVTSLAGVGTLQPCDILHLVLGPLHLDLLGLEIDLNQVVLDIVAQPGPGNLLGNLLCAIVSLLDAGGPVTGLAALLNQLLQLLG